MKPTKKALSVDTKTAIFEFFLKKNFKKGKLLVIFCSLC
ncbi:hypothetical protein FM120_08220 [Sphingobacterium faecium PCAi_F2.5]|nr:hypothetical protein BN1088_1432404 [Sphingobacterium sp. PM2-P1-29]SJN32719.1 hypothetical protein FM120_08220 [Sphingobacterium faecium PCAi_F2.5]